jgi:hypothetical protein
VGNALQQSRNLEVSPVDPALGVHLLSAAVEAVQCLDALPELEKTLERPEVENYCLPSMAADWRNKNDPQVGLVMAHAPGFTLYTQANFGGRYQFLGGDTEAFGSIDSEEKNGVRLIQYGPWLIAQNITATAKVGDEKGHPALLTALPAVPQARDLVSGKTVKLDKPLLLPPMTTVIFDLKSLGTTEVRDIPQP